MPGVHGKWMTGGSLVPWNALSVMTSTVKILNPYGIKYEISMLWLSCFLSPNCSLFLVFFFTIRLFTICFSDLPNKICVALKLPWIWGVTKMSCSGCLMGHFWQFPFKDIELQKGSWWKIFGFIFSLKWKTHFAERINRERYFGGATLKLQKYDTIKKRQICGVSCWW